MTKIAILGTGNMGRGLAARLEGGNVTVGSRSAGGYAAAVRDADIVVLALPYEAALNAARTLDLAGKVVVDITNALTPDYMNLTLGFTTSAAEEIQKAAPQARVVKAFNTIFSAILEKPRAQTESVPVFVAGDDAGAVDAVADLVRAAGFSVENAGTLDAARFLEPLAVLNVRLGYALGNGTSIAPAVLRLAA